MKRNILFTLLIIVLSALFGCTTEKFEYSSIGDSLTWQDGENFSETNIKVIGYQQVVKEKLDLDKIYNLGISGASLAVSSNYPMNGSIVKDISYKEINKSEVITIFVGTNDFKLNVPLGEINDLNETTFIGAYEILINRILENKSDNQKIYLISPLQRNKDGYDINKVNDVEYKLNDYVEAVKSIGEKFNIPVLDVYNNYDININNLDKYTIDGLHLNNDGYEVLGEDVATFISNN